MSEHIDKKIKLDGESKFCITPDCEFYQVCNQMCSKCAQLPNWTNRVKKLDDLFEQAKTKHRIFLLNEEMEARFLDLFQDILAKIPNIPFKNKIVTIVSVRLEIIAHFLLSTQCVDKLIEMVLNYVKPENDAQLTITEGVCLSFALRPMDCKIRSNTALCYFANMGAIPKSVETWERLFKQQYLVCKFKAPHGEDLFTTFGVV